MEMGRNGFTFEKLDLEGVRILVEWAAAEGWNPGPYDAEVFFATDPDGFYGFFKDGSMMAGGSVVSYNGLFGFMGFFIVKPDFRGSGIGRDLWYLRRNTLLSRLQPGAAIGMDGVVAMQDFYSRGGFEVAFRDERYERLGAMYNPHAHVRPILDSDVEAVLRYDAQCFGFSRPQFLVPWLQMPGVRSFRYVEDGILKGFAVLRKAMKGYKIGPLFADETRVAEALYESCLSAVPGEMVYLDIPVANEAAVDLVRKYEAVYVFECARMYYGAYPALPIPQIFGITSFELG